MRRTASSAAVVLMAVGVVGCGSSGGSHQVSAQTYANSLCSAVGPFEHEIYTHASALTNLESVAPAKGKATLTDFLTAVFADSQHARQAMRAAGTPDVPHGALIAGALVSMFTRLDSSLSAAQTGAEALPTNTPQAFRTAAKLLSDQVRTSVGDASSGLSGLKSSALEHAASLSPVCHSFG